MKRLSKTEKEQQERAALRQRIYDIALGASQGESRREEWFPAAIELERFITALKHEFSNEQDPDSDFRFQSHCIGKFDSIDSATDFLFRHRVRA